MLFSPNLFGSDVVYAHECGMPWHGMNMSPPINTSSFGLGPFPPAGYLLPDDKKSSISMEVLVHPEPIPHPAPRPAKTLRVAPDPAPPRDKTIPTEKPINKPMVPWTTIFSAPVCIIRGILASEDNDVVAAADDDDESEDMISGKRGRRMRRNVSATTMLSTQRWLDRNFSSPPCISSPVLHLECGWYRRGMQRESRGVKISTH